MQFEIKIDINCKEPKLILMVDKITDEANAIIKKLSDEAPQIICGFLEDKAEILEQTEIIRVYSSKGKVFAITNKNEYSLRLRLYELEDRLDKKMFVRISNSEIINMKKVNNFDLSFAGTICVALSNGAVTYVSRRYVAKIKQILGI